MTPKLKIHVFNNHGQYEGYVLRSDLANEPTPLVLVSGIRRSASRVSGRGWCVFLGPKAKLPSDIRH